MRIDVNSKTEVELYEQIADLHKKIDNFQRRLSKTKKVENELKLQKERLTERIKELSCLHNLSKLTSQKRVSFEDRMQKIVQLITSSLHYPSFACARIVIDDAEFLTPNYKHTRWQIKHDIRTFDRWSGMVEVCYLKGIEQLKSDAIFLKEEKRLLKSIAGLIGVMLEQIKTEEVRKKLVLNLQTQKRRLEEKNITLKEVLSQIEIEKRELKENIRINIERSIIPMIDKVKLNGLRDEFWAKYVDTIKDNLGKLASSFTNRITDKMSRLSPREIEICNMIRSGFTNKEISELCHISVLTVERHRHNIRKKLGIANKKINLATFIRRL